jgi:hypothetical protein
VHAIPITGSFERQGTIRDLGAILAEAAGSRGERCTVPHGHSVRSTPSPTSRWPRLPAAQPLYPPSPPSQISMSSSLADALNPGVARWPSDKGKEMHISLSAVSLRLYLKDGYAINERRLRSDPVAADSLRQDFGPSALRRGTSTPACGISSRRLQPTTIQIARCANPSTRCCRTNSNDGVN